MNSLLISVVFTLSLRWSYQQTPSKELSFCLNQPTTSNTLKTFWHDASSECELDTKLLIDHYVKVTQSESNNKDRCNLLLIHQMRKRLIHAAGQQLEEAIIVRSLKENSNLNRLLEEIHNLDTRISQSVWERAFNELYLFVEPEEMVAEILQLKSDEIQVFALQALLSKTKISTMGHRNMLPLIAYSVSKLLQSKKVAPATLENLRNFYHILPQELRFLYGLTTAKDVGLLNRAHWEYLYAPRDNGPDKDRRLPLTWSQAKNTTDTDGHLLLEFSDSGSVAFVSRFGAAPKYLYADEEHRAPYFWIGPGAKSTQWWQVIWPDDMQSTEGERPIALQNEKSREFLCATTAYDENRRYVVLLNGPENQERQECLWLVTGF